MTKSTIELDRDAPSFSKESELSPRLASEDEEEEAAVDSNVKSGKTNILSMLGYYLGIGIGFIEILLAAERQKGRIFWLEATWWLYALLVVGSKVHKVYTSRKQKRKASTKTEIGMIFVFALLAIFISAPLGRAFRDWWEDPAPSALAAAFSEYQKETIRVLSNLAFRLALQRVGTAIRNPMRAARYYKQLSTWLRRVRWALPIVAAIRRLIQSFRQYLRAARARIARIRARRAARRFQRAQYMSSTAAEKAALAIQCHFRAVQARRARTLAVLLSLRDRAVIIIQTNARAVLAQKHLESQRHKKHHTKDDAQAPTLLIRPDSRFRRTWDLLFVFLVALELGILLLRPPAKHHPPLHHSLRGIILGSKRSDTCLNDKTHHRAHQEKQTKHTHLIIAHLSKIPWWPKKKVPSPDLTASLCHTTLAKAHIALAHLVAKTFELVVSLTAALDVPISFFSGYVDQTTGILRPRHFLIRYATLFFSIITNPSQKHLYKALTSTLAWVNDDVTRIFTLARAYVALTPVRIAAASAALRCLHSYYHAHAFFHRRISRSSSSSST